MKLLTSICIGFIIITASLFSALQNRKKNKNAKEQKMKESERNFKNRQLQNKEYISFLTYDLVIY